MRRRARHLVAAVVERLHRVVARPEGRIGALRRARRGHEPAVRVAQRLVEVVVAGKPGVEKGVCHRERPAAARRGLRLEFQAAAARPADVAELRAAPHRNAGRRVLAVAVEDEVVAVDLEERGVQRRGPTQHLDAALHAHLEAQRPFRLQVGVAQHQRAGRGFAAVQLLGRRRPEPGRHRAVDRRRGAQVAREPDPEAVHVERPSVIDEPVAVAGHGLRVEVDADAVAAQVEGGRGGVGQAVLQLAVQRLRGLGGHVVGEHGSRDDHRAARRIAVTVQHRVVVVEAVAPPLHSAHQREPLEAGPVLGLQAALHLVVIVVRAVVVDVAGRGAGGAEAHRRGPERGVVLVLVQHREQVAALVDVVRVREVVARQVDVEHPRVAATFAHARRIEPGGGDAGDRAFAVPEAGGLLEAEAQVAAAVERVLQVARPGPRPGVRQVIEAVLFAVAVLQVTRDIVAREAAAHQVVPVTERSAVGFQLQALVPGAAPGGDEHRARQRVIPVEVRGAALDDLDALDVVEVDVDLAGALEHRHAVDHDRHAGLLAHVALALDAAQLDLDGFAVSVEVGGDAAHRAQHLDQVLGVLVVDLLGAESGGGDGIGGGGTEPVVDGRAGDGDRIQGGAVGRGLGPRRRGDQACEGSARQAVANVHDEGLSRCSDAGARAAGARAGRCPPLGRAAVAGSGKDRRCPGLGRMNGPGCERCLSRAYDGPGRRLRSRHEALRPGGQRSEVREQAERTVGRFGNGRALGRSVVAHVHLHELQAGGRADRGELRIGGRIPGERVAEGGRESAEQHRRNDDPVQHSRDASAHTRHVHKVDST